MKNKSVFFLLDLFQFPLTVFLFSIKYMILNVECVAELRFAFFEICCFVAQDLCSSKGGECVNDLSCKCIIVLNYQALFVLLLDRVLY